MTHSISDRKKKTAQHYSDTASFIDKLIFFGLETLMKSTQKKFKIRIDTNLVRFRFKFNVV